MGPITRRRTTPVSLQQTIDEITSRPHKVAPPVLPAPRVQSDALPIISQDELDVEREPFGGWLIKQHQHRLEWIAGLAKMAKLDPGFPKRGNPEDVRKHLTARGADGDAFEAVDDAEMEWERL